MAGEEVWAVRGQVAYFDEGLHLTDAVCLCAGVSPRSRHSPLLCSRVSPHAVASLYRAHFLRIPHYLAFTTSRRPPTPLMNSNCLCPLTSPPPIRHDDRSPIRHDQSVPTRHPVQFTPLPDSH